MNLAILDFYHNLQSLPYNLFLLQFANYISSYCYEVDLNFDVIFIHSFVNNFPLHLVNIF